MKPRKALIWVAVALSVAATIYEVAMRVGSGQQPEANAVLSFVPVLFAVAGALVATRQPGNIVGTLMLTIGVGTAVAGAMSLYLRSFDAAPPLPLGVVVAMILVAGWGWLFLIYPIFHMLLVFPDGKLLSPRWRWLVALEVLMLAVFTGATAVGEFIGPLDDAGEQYLWLMENPIGILSTETVEGLFGGVWSLGLVVLALGGFTSMVLRFRRSAGAERQQMKWLLYAFGLFAVVYAVPAMTGGAVFSHWIVNLAFSLSILGIPVAMAVAILRYRLFDIDVVIRRTILYVILTGLLGGVYVGSVFLFRDLFGGASGSSLGVAASTLLVAALFTPLRRRLQRLIDRRLFRTRYDMARVVERVAANSREQTDIETLTATLLAAVDETMQPRSVGVWVRHP